MVADYDGIAIATIQTVNYSYMMLHVGIYKKFYGHIVISLTTDMQ